MNYLVSVHALIKESSAGKSNAYFGRDLGGELRIWSAAEREALFDPQVALAAFDTPEVAISTEEVEAKLATLSWLYSSVIRAKWPLAKDGDGKEWGAKIAKGLGASESEEIYEGADEFIRAVESESIVLDLIRLERIDAQIESTFKRLVQTKTTKQALQRLQPKLITISNPNKPAEENKPDEDKS